MAAKTYKATAKGYANGIRYNPGDIFTWDDKPGSWMELVAEPEKPKRKVVKEQPEE